MRDRDEGRHTLLEYNHLATRYNHCNEFDITRSKNVTVIELRDTRESANILCMSVQQN